MVEDNNHLLILALDCATPLTSVAISEGERIIASEVKKPKVGHSETLMPMIDAMLKTEGLNISRFNIIASTVGPGTFTGIRVGIATAQGLSIPHNIKTMGIRTTLAIMLSVGRSEQHYAVVIDARRGMAYVEWFKWVKGRELPQTEKDIRLVKYEDLTKAVNGYTAVALREQDTYKLLEDESIKPTSPREPIAVGVAICSNLYSRIGVDTQLKPLYIRKPD